MSLIQELEELLTRIGPYNDRDLIERVLYQLKKTPHNHWDSEDMYSRNRK
jgi:hypothetical protein